MALKAEIETSTYVSNTRNVAMMQIQNAIYKGELYNFGIVKFHRIHQMAHNLMEQNFLTMDENMKTTLFRNGIKELTVIMYSNFTFTNPANHVSFELWYKAFSNMLLPYMQEAYKKLEKGTHNISQLNTNDSTEGNSEVEERVQGGRDCGERGRGRSRGG